MIPFDKFNRGINKKTGDNLFKIGYSESSKKPNLFYFSDLEVTFLQTSEVQM